jgi:peroxiredoxin
MGEGNGRKIAKVVGGALVVVAIVAVLIQARGFELNSAGVEVSERVPDYAAMTLEGEEHSFTGHLGEVVLVNVWATWCGPCRVEMPPIKALYDRYKDDGFTVLAVSIDAGPGYRGKVESFIEEYDLDFPILLDPEGRITRMLRTAGVPETFVLDREGRIVKRHIGATDWNSRANRALIEELLRM